AAALNNCDYGTAAQFVTFGQRRYLVATTYAPNPTTGAKTNTNCSFVLIDVTDGCENATTYNVLYPAAGLGSAANVDRISSVHSSVRSDKTIDVWVAASGQGLASYSYNGEVLSGIIDPATAAVRAFVSGNELHIEGANVKSAQIYNAAGALVASTSSNKANIRNLAKGIYVVKITDAAGNVTNRLITKK
ncbi:MAG: T9SS type A sorting domain-containing protein, partial [Bacteroidales bacterium]|nr:T9SS type A sorting domain-containing protein [Bacteroidales bacterium]